MNISSSVKVLNLNAAVSSASSSSVLVGMETMPPKVVRCVVAHAAPLPSAATLVVTPAVDHSPSAASQYRQVSFTEQFASRYCGGHSHLPSTHEPRPEQ